MTRNFIGTLKSVALLIALAGAMIGVAACTTPGGSNDGYSAPPSQPGRGSHM